MVVAGLVRLWRQMARGAPDQAELELQLLNRGLMNRILGKRARALIRSSWHMYPVGLLFGLGLETASEVTLLSLSASTAASGALPALAALTLPLLFAAGLLPVDTCDSLPIARPHSAPFSPPPPPLYSPLAPTRMTLL